MGNKLCGLGRASGKKKDPDLSAYDIWYRHTGEILPSENWDPTKTPQCSISAQEILEDVGEHSITHLCINGRWPPSLNDIAPNLTHLWIKKLEDYSQLESLRGLKELKVLHFHNSDFSNGLPSVIGELKSLTELHIDYCGITDLPENLIKLRELKLLHLWNNNFSSGLPSVIGELKSLTELHINRCALRDLPENMNDLKQLRKLDLAENPFPDGCPDVIPQLISLTELSLRECSLKSLPPRFGELEKLEVLNLNGNKFSSGLPDVIAELGSLTELQLQNCTLTDLPQSVSELKLLKVLKLGGNYFSCGLPEVITKLTSLTKLTLGGCRLTSLPPRFVELQQLEELVLEGNDFSDVLPDVIEQLSSLTELNLRYCSLTDLPQRLSNLKSLQFIDLSRNSLLKVPLAVFDLNELIRLNLTENYGLSEIDERILQLKNLQEVKSSNCPSLRSPPYQVCQQGIDAIRSYFVELAKGEEVSTIPVAIIGNSLSGKTSIVRSLKEGKRELTYREKASTKDEITKVFNVEKLEFSKSHVRLIDYGGQEIYHIAYHLALKEQCVPLIVVNIFEFFTLSSSVGYEKATRHVCFDWLCHLYLACPNLGRPLLALTHIDKLSSEELENSKDALKKTVDIIRRKWLDEENRCKDKFQFRLKRIKHLSNLNFSTFLEEDTFEFNNDTNMTSNIECLKENIGHRCLDLEHKIPQSWEEVSAFLEKASDEPYKELSAIEQRFPDRDCKTILEYMHHTGKIMWFRQKTDDGDNELSAYIFHQIPAITKVMALLFHHSPEEMKSDREQNFIPFDYKDRHIGPAKHRKLLNEFLGTGVLDEALLYDLVVSDSGFDFTIAVKLLKCFHIVHGPVQLRVSEKPREVYTVPSFATKPMDHSWETDGLLQLRLDIKFHGLPLPKYAYQLTSVSVLNQAEQFNIVDARSNGAIAKHGGNATYLCHDPKAGKVTLQVSSSIEQLSNSWVRLRKTAEDIINVISNRWKASRVEVIHYCTHCLFLRDANPEYTVDPDWFQEKFTFDGLQLVACYKGEDLTVPKPLMFPCSNLSSEEITRLDSYLKGLQSTHECST